MTAPLTTADLLALADKYERLLELRHDRARGGGIAERSTLRDLAARFPGSLRELDLLPLEDLERRARACRDAATGAAPPEWVYWMHDFHALLRCAADLRTELGATAREARRAALDTLGAERLATELGRRHRVIVDASLLSALASPRSGRTVVVVLEALASRHDRSIRDIAEVLLPRARRGTCDGPREDHQGASAQSPSVGTNAGTSPPASSS